MSLRFWLSIEVAIVLICYFCIILVIGVLGNGWFIFSIGTKTRRQSDDLFMMCLATADLVLPLFGIPANLLETGVIGFSDSVDMFLYTLSLLGFLYRTTFLVSSWLLVVLIVYRYRSFIVSEENRRISLPKQAIGLIVMFCVAGLFSAIPFLVQLPESPWRTEKWAITVWLLAFVIVGSFLPFVCFFACLGITIAKLWGNFLRNADGGDMEMLSRNLAAKKRALLMIVIMAVQFFVLTLPFNIMLLLADIQTSAFIRAKEGLGCITLLTCCFKPIIYAVMRPIIETRPCQDAREIFPPQADTPLIDDCAAAETCH